MSKDRSKQEANLDGLFEGVPFMMQRLKAGFEIAKGYRFSMFGCEHLLFALTDNEILRGMIAQVGGDPDKFRASLEDAFTEHAAINGPSEAEPKVCEALLTVSKRVADFHEAHPGVDASELIREAMMGLIDAADGSMICESALLDSGAEELIGDRSNSSFFENEFDFLDFDDLAVRSGSSGTEARTPLDVGAWLDDLTPPDEGNLKDMLKVAQKYKAEPKPEPPKPAPVQQKAEPAKPSSSNQKPDGVADAVNASLRDLGKEAGLGMIDPVLGRDREVDTILSILRRRRKGSALIYGEAGIGKTAIAEGLAIKLRSSDVEASLARRPYYELSMSDLVAGTKYRGDFEARMKHLIERMRDERAIVFIDEFHMLIGSGSTYGRGMDGANLMKPALARGEITVIGATTPSEMRQLRQDTALMRRFEAMPILEQTRAQTEEIMDRACWPYLEYHNLDMASDVISEICRITDLYQPERRFPDKAFDLLDASCVNAVEESVSRNMASDRMVLRMSHVHAASDRMGLRRPGRPGVALATKLSGLKSGLCSDIPGQEAAVEALAASAITSCLNLDTSGVRGSYLVNGPVGSGKALLARSFAERMGLAFISINMQANHERNGQTYLLGAPGPSGMDRPGVLVEAGDSHRDMVIMLEDIDKADHTAHETIASVLKTGSFRSSDGRMISLRGAWIFMNMADTESNIFNPGFRANSNRDDAPYDTADKLLPKGLLSVIRTRLNMSTPACEALAEVVKASLDELVEKSSDFGIELSVEEGVAYAYASRCKTWLDASSVVNSCVGPMIAQILTSALPGERYILKLDDDGNPVILPCTMDID